MSHFFNRCVQSVVIAFAVTGLVSCASQGASDSEINAATPLSKLDSEKITFTKQWRDKQSQISGDYAVLLSPVLSDDTLYSASENGVVEARSLQNGRSVWRHKVKSKITAGLGSDVNHVYFVTQDFVLVALDKENGQQVWQTTLQSGVVAVPSSNNLVLVVHGMDGKISGFDPHSGKNFWVHQQTIPELTQRGNSQPQFVANQWVVQGVDNGKVVALRAQQGGLSFEVKVNTTANAAFSDLDLPVLATPDGLIVASEQKGLMMLSFVSGEILWQGRYKNDDIKSISLQGANVIAVTKSDKVYSHTAQTGKLNWVNDALRYRGLNPVSGSRALVYVLDSDGVLHTMDAASGEIIGREDMKLGRTSNPVLVNHANIVAMDDEGRISAYKQKGYLPSEMMIKKVKIKAPSASTSDESTRVDKTPKADQVIEEKVPEKTVAPRKQDASASDAPPGKVAIRKVKVKVNKPTKTNK